MTSEFDPFVQTPDDNGFEKLDIQSEAASKSQEVGTTHQEKNPEMSKSEVSSSTPLIDLGAAGDSAPSVKCCGSGEIGVAVCELLSCINPKVKDLLLWKDPKKSGAVLATSLAVLISIAFCSFLSVLVYLCMSVLAVSFTFVVYKKVMAAIQKTSEGHPFQCCLDMSLEIPQDKLHQLADDCMAHVTCVAKILRHVFLVEDVVDSLKCFLLLWALSYWGAWFNTLTLIIIDVVILFTLPKFYMTFKTQIDEHCCTLYHKACDVYQQLRAKIPFGKKDKKE